MGRGELAEDVTALHYPLRELWGGMRYDNSELDSHPNAAGHRLLADGLGCLSRPCAQTTGAARPGAVAPRLKMLPGTPYCSEPWTATEQVNYTMHAVIGTESGDTYQFELDEQQENAVVGARIGEKVDGEAVGLPGYVLEVTGGSDTEGFPMRESVEGTGRKRLLLKDGVGARDLEQGERTRTSVRGNTVSSTIAQLNLRVVEAGSDPIADLLAEGGDQETDDEGEDA